MILLEGPDGAGKTTLLNELTTRLNLPARPRFSTSKGGPMDNLYSRVYEDMLTYPHERCGIYDRHPLVSEYVYGQIRPDSEIDPNFLWPSAAKMLQLFAQDVLLVLCLPPFHEVAENVRRGEQLEGVRENAFRMYQAYQMIRIWWPNQENLVTYDYTSKLSQMQTHAAVQLHVTKWNRNHHVI